MLIESVSIRNSTFSAVTVIKPVENAVTFYSHANKARVVVVVEKEKKRYLH